MASDRLSQWLDALGYSAESGALHRSADAIDASHAYAPELRALLRPEGDVRARAVFDVEGVPTVVFLVDDMERTLSAEALNAVRQRLWNQNLVSVVLAITDARATALPVQPLRRGEQSLRLEQASPTGPFSAAEVRSSDLARRLEAWFKPDARVDRKLLKNLQLAIEQLIRSGIAKHQAQLLMGQLLFVAYLEHRRVVSETYRARRKVGEIHDLIHRADKDGLLRLIERLRKDFNGDFLAATPDAPETWAALSPATFEVLDRFLRRVDLETGQKDFWNYDFSYIPVELLSGLYESFLTDDEQAALGAYYTPRHLATLTVDEALRRVPNPNAVTVFDGACGSGILLTTVFRRLIAMAERTRKGPFGFADRCTLLRARIFGGDLNEMACRVTAFSLYLALLEGLEPADVLALQDQDDVKLPALTNHNIVAGERADIFGPKHPFAQRQFSLVISNPPWKEAAGNESTSADEYASTAKVPFVRRQSAGLYAFRALDFLAEGGTLCLILPIPLFLGPSSGPFMPSLFARARPHRLINFGDLQGLLFPTGENACHVFVATRRSSERPRIPVDETFDYWVPKADLSLAFGRLALLSADRHAVQTQAVLEDPQWLVTLMWGDDHDVALLARLALRGRLADQWSGRRARWTSRKGVHLEDRSRQAQPVTRLRAIPHVEIERLREGLPILHGRDLTLFPNEIKSAVGLSDGLFDVFDGPRVLFPDGFSRVEAEVRTNYLEVPASFTSSIGVIAGPREDAALLRFTAVYLRSSLAKYFLLMRVWKMLCERNALHLKDLDDLPFHAPQQAVDPEVAADSLARISELMQQLRQMGREQRAASYAQLRSTFDDLVFDYFAVSGPERRRVREAVEVLLPSVRPRAFGSLNTVAQQRARRDDIQRYAKALAASLDGWRDALGGRGQFKVSVRAMEPSATGPVGTVRVELDLSNQGRATSDVTIEDEAVAATLATLRAHGLSVTAATDVFQLSPDTLIWTDSALYLVRPLAKRNWLERRAANDAARIVRDVQATARGRTPERAA